MPQSNIAARNVTWANRRAARAQTATKGRLLAVNGCQHPYCCALPFILIDNGR